MGMIFSRKKKAKKPVVLDGDVNFDHFQVIRAIGRGSFSKVAIVQKRDSKLMYAMKYVRKSSCVKLGALRNVIQEVEILRTLDHPNLINLWFTFQDEEDLFLITDLLLGGDLRYHLNQGVIFTEESVIMFVYEVALALDYLRAMRIIHRDIKPDNIILDDAGHAHITDFNIATVLKPRQLATLMSGTKPYMAPEIFDCAVGACTGYAFSVDWWSLGVCAFEMLAKETPYKIRSKTSLEKARAMFQEEITLPDLIHPFTKEMYMQLLDPNAGTRITSLRELQQLKCYQYVDMNKMILKEYKPAFEPPTDHLNCDPSYELEEMIIEKYPLHKKNKRLEKIRLRQRCQSTPNLTSDSPTELRWGFIRDFKLYNRYEEQAQSEEEMKEQLWERELQEAMNASRCTQQPTATAALDAPSCSYALDEPCCSYALDEPSCSYAQRDVPSTSALKTSSLECVKKRIINTPRKTSRRVAADPQPNYPRIGSPSHPPQQHSGADKPVEGKFMQARYFTTFDFEEEMDYIDKTPSPPEDEPNI